MPNWGYSARDLDPARTARSSGRDLKVSPKAAREICAAIRMMNLGDAEGYLQAVIAQKRAVPFKRHKKEVPHRRGLEGWSAGRYPVRASKAILKVVRGLRANAEEKGLDTDRLRIIHAATQRGGRIRKFIPRAFGRSSPYDQQLTHVELAVAEV